MARHIHIHVQDRRRVRDEANDEMARTARKFGWREVSHSGETYTFKPPGAYGSATTLTIMPTGWRHEGVRGGTEGSLYEHLKDFAENSKNFDSGEQYGTFAVRPGSQPKVGSIYEKDGRKGKVLTVRQRSDGMYSVTVEWRDQARTRDASYKERVEVYQEGRNGQWWWAEEGISVGNGPYSSAQSAEAAARKEGYSRITILRGPTRDARSLSQNEVDKVARIIIQKDMTRAQTNAYLRDNGIYEEDYDAIIRAVIQKAGSFRR